MKLKTIRALKTFITKYTTVSVTLVGISFMDKVDMFL